MRVLIAAAGTGGHINPGIAIANKIKEEEPDSKILFIGTERGLEKDLVPRSGYKLKTINAYGIRRSFTLENIKRFFKTMHSVKEVEAIINEFKPDVVIGTGGYVTVSVGKAAIKKKIPLFLHESNAFPGVAIKLLQKKATEIFVGFEDAKQRLPKAKKIKVTGTPTKVKNLNLSADEKRKIVNEIGFTNNLPTVLAFGGSQGAKSINDSLFEIIKTKANNNYNLMWATGKDGFNTIKDEFAKVDININNIENVKILPYIYNMEEVLNAVDLVIARSGAMTITEISNAGVPAIFIPFPYAAENHQEYNARVLVDRKAARLILDKDLNAQKLHEEIELVIDNDEKRIEMGKNALEISKTDVLDNIYEEIVSNM